MPSGILLCGQLLEILHKHLLGPLIGKSQMLTLLSQILSCPTLQVLEEVSWWLGQEHPLIMAGIEALVVDFHPGVLHHRHLAHILLAVPEHGHLVPHLGPGGLQQLHLHIVSISSRHLADLDLDDGLP